MLQRGRAQLSAEFCQSLSLVNGHGELQRGRAQLSAELRGIGLLLFRQAGASTGPRSIERGVAPSPANVPTCVPVLQRGRAQLSAEFSLVW